jgi:hypothetical protein
LIETTNLTIEENWTSQQKNSLEEKHPSSRTENPVEAGTCDTLRWQRIVSDAVLTMP